MSSRWAHVLTGLGVLALGLVWLLGAVDLPPCPFATWLDLLCPMCGSTRAVEALMRGDLIQALRLNPMVPFWGLMLVLAALDLVWAVCFGPEVHGPCRRFMTWVGQTRPALVLLLAAWLATGAYLNLAMRAVLL